VLLLAVVLVLHHQATSSKNHLLLVWCCDSKCENSNCETAWDLMAYANEALHPIDG
jgi:hypothetical protein